MNKEYVASPASLCGTERSTLSEGKGKGVEIMRVYNGKLDLTLSLDRGMDIFRLFYRGRPVGYVSKNGMVSPRLAENRAYPFASSFPAGFLYTCGLDNVGAAVENGRVLPQHGCATYLPAENVHVETEERDGEYYLHVIGQTTFTSLFGNTLLLRRRITLREGGDELTVQDEITNEGATEEGYLLMYHCNFGYPVLDENARLTLAGESCRLVSAVGDTAHCLRFEPPAPARPEEVYLHTLKEGRGIKAKLENHGLCISMEFDASDFPYLVEWKSMACGDYVLGIEPSTTPMPERCKRILKAGEKATHMVTWRFEER